VVELDGFCALVLDDLLSALGPVTALEVLSMLYALVAPWDALDHRAVLELLGERYEPHGRAARWRTFRTREDA